MDIHNVYAHNIEIVSSAPPAKELPERDADVPVGGVVTELPLLGKAKSPEPPLGKELALLEDPSLAVSVTEKFTVMMFGAHDLMDPIPSLKHPVGFKA